MQYEVEQKHRVDDLDSLKAELMAQKVVLGEVIDQTDQYYNHPCRDFAETDEALRIRTMGQQSYVTYKGPKLDSTTKTRQEIELALHADDPSGAKFGNVLAALGFRSVFSVHKRRTPFQMSVEGREVEGALDEVTGVGTFVELELQSDEEGLAEATRLVSILASELRLGPMERRSYLEMLLATRHS